MKGLVGVSGTLFGGTVDDDDELVDDGDEKPVVDLL